MVTPEKPEFQKGKEKVRAIDLWFSDFFSICEVVKETGNSGRPGHIKETYNIIKRYRKPIFEAIPVVRESNRGGTPYHYRPKTIRITPINNSIEGEEIRFFRMLFECIELRKYVLSSLPTDTDERKKRIDNIENRMMDVLSLLLIEAASRFINELVWDRVTGQYPFSSEERQLVRPSSFIFLKPAQSALRSYPGTIGTAIPTLSTEIIRRLRDTNLNPSVEDRLSIYKEWAEHIDNHNTRALPESFPRPKLPYIALAWILLLLDAFEHRPFSLLRQAMKKPEHEAHLHHILDPAAKQLAGWLNPSDEEMDRQLRILAEGSGRDPNIIVERYLKIRKRPVDRFIEFVGRFDTKLSSLYSKYLQSPRPSRKLLRQRAQEILAAPY